MIKRLEDEFAKFNNQSKSIDYITFAGNGEPTLHPRFGQIMDGVISLRNRLMPDANIAVLSNATTLTKQSVLRAMEKVDKRISGHRSDLSTYQQTSGENLTFKKM